MSNSDNVGNTETQKRTSVSAQCVSCWFESTYSQTLCDVERELQSSGGLGASRPLR